MPCSVVLRSSPGADVSHVMSFRAAVKCWPAQVTPHPSSHQPVPASGKWKLKLETKEDHLAILQLVADCLFGITRMHVSTSMCLVYQTSKLTNSQQEVANEKEANQAKMFYNSNIPTFPRIFGHSDCLCSEVKLFRAFKIVQAKFFLLQNMGSFPTYLIVQFNKTGFMKIKLPLYCSSWVKPKTVLPTKINFIFKFYGIQHSIKAVLQNPLIPHLY